MSTPPVPATNPLTGADLARINDALQRAKAGLQQAELAQRAGLDVSAQTSQLQQTLQQLTAIKQVYFPGQ